MSRDAKHFDAIYEGQPLWAINRSQPVVEEILAEALGWRVLDLGCGLGHNSARLATKHSVTGIDFSAIAIKSAKKQFGAIAKFRVRDALTLKTWRKYDAVVDTGVWHIFEDSERPKYAATLNRVLRSGGKYCLVVFRDDEPNWGGPRRISKHELEENFSFLRDVIIRKTRYETSVPEAMGRAWLLIGTMP